MDEQTLAQLLKEAADAHHVYEQTLGHADADWPTWYAHYMIENGLRPLMVRWPVLPVPQTQFMQAGE